MSRIIEEDSLYSVNPVSRVHAWRSPPEGGICMMNVFTHHSVYEAIMDEAEGALPNETGGFLLGHVGFDPDSASWHNWIDQAVPITPAASNPAHFTFTWKDVDRVRNERERQAKALIGWYHTHPGLGIFLSDTDIQKTHQQLFNESFQVALVYDPASGKAGYFFRAQSGILDPGMATWREFQLVKSAAESKDRNEPVQTEGNQQAERT